MVNPNVIMIIIGLTVGLTAYSQVEYKATYVDYCKATTSIWISAEYSDDGDYWTKDVSGVNFSETINEELTYFDGDNSKPFLTTNKYYYPNKPKRTSDYKSDGSDYEFNSYQTKTDSTYTMHLTDGAQKSLSNDDYPVCISRLNNQAPISQLFLFGMNIKTTI